MAELDDLEKRGKSDLAACADLDSVRTWNTRYFGKQGQVTLAMKKIGEVPPAERPGYGQALNRVKLALQESYNAALTAFNERALDHSLSSVAIDVTLPGRPRHRAESTVWPSPRRKSAMGRGHESSFYSSKHKRIIHQTRPGGELDGKQVVSKSARSSREFLAWK